MGSSHRCRVRSFLCLETENNAGDFSYSNASADGILARISLSPFWILHVCRREESRKEKERSEQGSRQQKRWNRRNRQRCSLSPSKEKSAHDNDARNPSHEVVKQLHEKGNRKRSSKIRIRKQRKKAIEKLRLYGYWRMT